MKVKLLVSRAGTNFAQSIGEVINVSADEGARMIQSEQAVPVNGSARRTMIKKPARRETRKKYCTLHMVRQRANR